MDACFTDVTACTECSSRKSLIQLPLTKTNDCHVATVWNGSCWTDVRHGTKVCKSCGCRFKLNYAAKQGQKKNILTEATLKAETIVLVHPSLGFRYSYLRLLWNRICRANVSFLAEASSILMTFPDATVGSAARRGCTKTMSDDSLARWIAQAIFIYLRYQESCFAFDVDDPVPDDDEDYGKLLQDTHIIYNHPEEDPRLKNSNQLLDVVTDGNMPLARLLCADERRGLKRLAGRPKAAPKKKISRCQAVSETESIQVSRHTIGGLFATINMRMGSGGHGNQILQLGEMKNSENKAYKISFLKKLVSKKIRGERIQIGKYTHDCGCTLVDDIEGVYCKKVYLDGYHGKKHKCRTPLVTRAKFRTLNSSAAEQLWKRMEGLQRTLAGLARPRYRMFLYHYCRWRNHFSAGKWRSDLNPSMSKRRASKRFAKRTA